MRFPLKCLAAALVLAIAAPAGAAWNVARSKHFVIYADESPAALGDFATHLEKFDQAVRMLLAAPDPVFGDGNRLTVFVVPSVGAVQRLYGDRSGTIGGFYEPHASGPLAIVPRQAGGGDANDLNANIIFLHEYSHHLMMQALDRPLPEWVIEGFAEFLSTARFEQDGAVSLGTPAKHRAESLFLNDSMPLEKMLGANYSRITGEEREYVYSRGWLLTHYLTFEPSRRGQLNRYVEQIAKGIPALDAARFAFGDLRKLDRDLTSYLNRRRFTYVKIPAEKFQAPVIEVRQLSEGASKVIMLRAKSKSGVNDKTAEPLAVQVRAVEAHYRGDELVEATLAEAELDSGHTDESEAAADRAIRANPRNTEALVLKGRAIAGRASKAGGSAAHTLFDQARKTFIAANRIDPEDPEPLMEFYKAFVAEGLQPTKNAIAALHYASDLAPQDAGLRMNSALQFLADGKASEARRALAPIAYNPHGQKLAEVARQVMGKIDAGDVKAALEIGEAGAKEE